MEEQNMSILKPTIANVIGGLLVLIIASIVGMVWGDFFWTKTKITSPKENEKVPWMTSLEGEFSKKYKDMDLWVVVQPNNSPKYHPQTSKIPKLANHKWTAVAYIGESESKNIGEKFIIHLISADTAASSIFESYLINATSNKSWPGMDFLPPNASAIASTSVYRR
jgi:hypothetical protein